MKKTRRGTRSGSLTLELLLILPILLVIILAIVEFSLILVARQQLTAASREGARVAAMGGTESEVEDAVLNTLGSGVLSTATVNSVLEDAKGNPLPTGAQVRVVVSLPTARVTPNLLAPIGFSIANDVLRTRTVMTKE
ncbi:MAG: TadE/TadG family type IV pilus assembly protein [Gemmataceae bacterium]